MKEGGKRYPDIGEVTALIFQCDYHIITKPCDLIKSIKHGSQTTLAYQKLQTQFDKCLLSAQAVLETMCSRVNTN